MVTASKILRIPLARGKIEDMGVWGGDLLGEFSIKSAYKLLHEGSLNPSYTNYDSRKHFRKFWKIHVPYKNKIEPLENYLELSTYLCKFTTTSRPKL